MKNEFNKLVATMQKWDLYQTDDEVGMCLETLRKKIDEVENRMECARRSAREINVVISKYTQKVDGNEEFKMSVNDHDIISLGSNDVGYSLDLDETMPIIDNWYGLFTEEMESIAEKEMEILMHNPSNLVAYNFSGSWGTIDTDMNGYVIEVHGEREINGEHNHYFDIVKFDIDEYKAFCIKNNITHGECEDILAVGYTSKDGKYTEPDKSWREEIFGIDEEDIKLKRGEPIPTSLCMTPQTHEIVKDIIAKLKVIEVDGETMEYILEQVGMTDQMLRQLIMEMLENFLYQK